MTSVNYESNYRLQSKQAGWDFSKHCVYQIASTWIIFKLNTWMGFWCDGRIGAVNTIIHAFYISKQMTWWICLFSKSVLLFDKCMLLGHIHPVQVKPLFPKNSRCEGHARER